ncbi:amidohydrolase family protein [Crossiella sp. SN42]|uniref:N-acyl-D-amino-acid deacylase family protein n=1 Tax=Crossiella sp. SN42 TaxID=2944808 RepID=UPI00207CBEF4|nr:amidohydrolase family protein [Crossiella sp. SN42]MCO1574299.1 amidohydrolase family protein [Crossiella sp. SN42]
MTRTPRRGVAAVLAAGLLLATPAPAVAAPPELDAIIHGGKVFDGSGAPGRITDVGLKDGRVHRIGDLSRVRARARYNATGQFVTPGFIDVHAHTDTGAPLASAKSSLTQGVTTELLGPDGGGTYEIDKQLKELDAVEKGINLAPYVGFNTVWQATMGEKDTRPTAVQSAQMRARIERGMRQGGWGVSGGLGYPPASYARTNEVVDVVRGARSWRTLFTDHIRDETNLVVESTAEDIAIGKAAGLMPEITHLKVAGPRNWGKSATMLRLLREARAAGTHAGGDVYPYTAASTALEFYVPGWAKDGGTAAMLARFADPALRPRIDTETSAFVRDDVGTPDKVVLPELANRSVADLMAEYGGVSIGEAIMRILAAHNGSILAVMHIGSEEDLANFITDPFVAFSSDGGVTDSAHTHPRHYGSYPRVLGRYVRERGLLSWEEAIRKMTGLPATMVGMVDRGYLAEGMAADVTVFDPKTIGDRATFAQPKQYSVGVQWVFVNGKLALTGGEPTRAAAGQALRRASSMPTRPQNAGRDLKANAAGLLRPLDGRGASVLAASLSQRAGERTASGAVLVAGPFGVLRSTRLGRLQTSDGWFSVTGIGKLANGTERAFTLTVDEQDPLAGPDRRRATVRIDGTGLSYGSLT